VRRYLFMRGLTGIGRATVDVLGLNDARLEGPLGPRHDAVLVDAYPPAWARTPNVARPMGILLANSGSPALMRITPPVGL